MKRILPLFLLLMVLCGCAAEPEAPTETIPPPPATEAPAEATIPTGFYDPNSELENTTAGAVRVYPLNMEDCSGMLPMGDDILLFSGDETTSLSRISGDKLYVIAATELDCAISATDPGVQVSEKGVTYYDKSTHDLVFLDIGLKEVRRVSLPEDISGSPTLSADRKSLYFCTPDSLRVLDLETGFHKLLKEMFFEEQTVQNLHCNDSVVECSVLRSDGAAISLFFSAETGETLWEALDEVVLTTSGDQYFAACTDGAYTELLTGTTDFGPYALHFDDIHAFAVPLLEMNGAMLVSSKEDNNAVTLHYFDLESGKRIAQLELSGSSIPRSNHTDPKAGCIWLLRFDEDYGCDTIYRWEPLQTPTQDEAVYIASRFTYESPDTNGLTRCSEKAAEISVKFGADVRVWTDAVSNTPDAYVFTPEYQAPVLLESLQALDQALAQYPDKFLKKVARGTTSGTLRICLVRSIEGASDDALAEVGGLQYWDENENAFIYLEVGPTLEQSLYHELFHLIESRVLSTSSAYDDWEELNPEGFQYDYSYLTNQFRQDSDFLEGENRAFIDVYSMSFPAEDRARIMEYAMMPGNADCFTAPSMQAKLRQLCLGIRDAFNLEGRPEGYLWEQYLAEPLS